MSWRLLSSCISVAAVLDSVIELTALSADKSTRQSFLLNIVWELLTEPLWPIIEGIFFNSETVCKPCLLQ